MRITVKTNNLQKILDKAWDFTSKKNSVSITGTFHLEAKDGKLEIMATETLNGFIGKIDADIEETGSLLVNAEKFRDTINNITGHDEIILFTKDAKLSIRNVGSKKFQMNLRTIDPENFPPIERGEDLEYAVFKQSEILNMIDKTAITIGKDTSRIFITGAYLVKEGSKLVMVSTDGKRLSKISRDADEIPPFEGAIIPVPFLNSIKNIADGKGIMEFAVKNRKIYVRMEDIFIYTILLSGNFPNYNRVIPSSFASHAVIDTKDMKAALKIIENASDSSKTNNKSEFSFRENGCTFTSITDENDGSYELNTEYEGEPIKITISDKLLSPIISKIPDEKFYIWMNTSKSAIMITWESDKNALYVMMPINA